MNDTIRVYGEKVIRQYNLQFSGEIKALLEPFDLSTEFEWFLKSNGSNNLPYHNLYHTLSVVKNSYNGAEFYNLPYDSTRNLLIAALFHDFDHTGGHKDDDTNISKALLGLGNCFGHGNPDLQAPQRHILCTRFPFIRKPVCIEQKILRDADIIQGLLPFGYEMVIQGLRQEIEIARKCAITEQEMLKGQIAFLSNIELFTDWAESNYRQKFIDLIETFKGLVR